ncbi:MAG: hypothetical protein ACJ76H_00245, partial [Bacteriovoracaceae bacterium]
MKLTVLFILGLYSLSATAEWRLPRFNRNDESTGGLRVVWSCPSANRGVMPEEREVEIYYDENGEVKFRPDIFRAHTNALAAITGIFKKKSSSDVDECLRSFLQNIPQTITEYQNSQCNNSQTAVCSKSNSDISTDVARAVRESKFYQKYANDLQTIAPSLPAPRPAQPVSTETRAPLPVKVKPAVPVPQTSVDAPITASNDPDTARTQLLDYMTDNYSRLRDLRNFSNRCPNLGGEGDSNYCREQFQKNNQFLNNMSQMFTAVRGESVPVSRVLQSLDCLPSNKNQFQDLEDILHRMDKRDDCSPMESIGEYKMFKKKNGQGWYTSGNYLLRKTGQNAYEATVNLNFINGGGTKSSTDMMATVRACLATSSRFMKGPGGATLAIRALTPQETQAQLPADQRPDVDTINIRTTGLEMNSANFGDDVNCPTVTHEILHHLGLCDEYLEGRTNIVSGMSRSRAEEWSCRVVPKGPSIMKNHIEAYNASVSQQMTCECVDEACRSALRNNDQKSLAQRKLLMTSSPYPILGPRSNLCPNPKFLTTVSMDNVPDPDKAYVDVQATGGTLTFQQRS